MKYSIQPAAILTIQEGPAAGCTVIIRGSANPPEDVIQKELKNLQDTWANLFTPGVLSSLDDQG